MALHGIDQSGSLLMRCLLEDTRRGQPFAGQNAPELYEELLSDPHKSILSPNYSGVSYVWWQFFIDHGEINVETIGCDDLGENHPVTSESGSTFFDAILPAYNYDMLNVMISMGVTIYQPILTRVDMTFSTDYWGEGSEEYYSKNLYITDDHGIHWFPLEVSEIKGGSKKLTMVGNTDV